MVAGYAGRLHAMAMAKGGEGMARLLSGGPVDLPGVDWNARLVAAGSAVLEAGVNDTVHGLVYRDVLVIDGPAGPLWLWGEGLVADPQGRLIAGTVAAIAQGGTRFEPDWILQEIFLPATAVADAVWSAAEGDDLAILRLALAGNDILRLGAASSAAFGGRGADTLQSGRGDDTLSGDQGDDLIESFFGNDLIHGGAGNDTIRASAGNDTVFGGAGHDRLYATSGDNRMQGGRGDDSVVGGSGADTLRGDEGRDTLEGGASHDRLSGGVDGDLLWGGDDDDRLTGDDGNDTLWGDDDNDRLYGGADEDALYGGRHDDVLDGGAGHDTLEGGDGNDILREGNGAGVLAGGSGNDTLVGGRGNDTHSGGTGEDVFVFRPDAGRDVITDFTAGAILFNDRLQLSAVLWAGQGVLDAVAVVERFAGLDADGFVRLSFENAGTTIVLEGVTDAALLIGLIDIV